MSDTTKTPASKPAAAAQKKRSAGRRWVAVVVALLVTHVGVVTVLVLSSSGDPSHQVIPNYYRKAIKWDRHMAQQRRNVALGWSVALRVGPALADGAGLRARRVEIKLHDRLKGAVRGVSVSVSAFHKARAARVLRAKLRDGGDGSYSVSLPLRRDGLWQFDVVIVRGGARFTTRVVRDVGVGGAS